MAKLTFTGKSSVLKRMKDFVMDDPDSTIPVKLRQKIKYTKPFQWNSFIKHLCKPSIQKIIKNAIDVPVNKKVVQEYYTKYRYSANFEVTPQLIRRAIRQYLQDRYCELSVFDGDVKSFVLKRKNRWEALMDTSVREAIWDICKKLKKKEHTKSPAKKRRKR